MSAGTCVCGRSLIFRPGDLEETCAECRSRPDSCCCDWLTLYDDGGEDETPKYLPTVRLSDVETPDIARLTSTHTLPVYYGMLHGLVGPGESGKSTIAAYTVLDVVNAGHRVLVLDGEMSGPAWRRKLTQLGASDEVLTLVHYAEITADSASVKLIRATVDELDMRLIVWDSALSLIAHLARSENDNAEVSRVFDRLRGIIREGPAGLVVDHTALSSAALISRGASAKFNAFDISYGVRLAEGSVPGPFDTWSSVVSIEKDRHGLIGHRHDHEVTFQPLGGMSLHVDITETGNSTNRLSPTNPVTEMVARIGGMDPPPTSANDVYRRLGGKRMTVLAAYKKWCEQ